MVERSSAYSVINFTKLSEIWNSNNNLRAFLFDNKLLFNYAKACDRCRCGHISLRQDKTCCDGEVWHCTNNKCNVNIPLRKDSFFSHSHLLLVQIVQVIYYKTYKYLQDISLNTRLAFQQLL